MQGSENLEKKHRVVVGMSGGVDSSVAAYCLKEQGHEVIGLFMKNWEEKDENGVCHSAQDYEDVARVCERLDIPYYSIEFVKEYWENVFLDFIKDFKVGLTPNPDILCNREIKFNVFLKKAMELNADYLATGHYCQIDRSSGESLLKKATDPSKDQTYFLYTVNKEILDRVLFPIGHLPKKEVREIAKRIGLATHAKKDSTGICFIGERNFRNFLSQYIKSQKGDFRNLDGKKVGTHLGACFYTLGQRRGLTLGGEGEPWYVVGKSIEDNTVFVERGSEHPALYADELIASDLSWVSGRAPEVFPFRCTAKARYRQCEQDCELFLENSSENSQENTPKSSPESKSENSSKKLRVVFDSPQRALTPGQSVVFYSGDLCIGGGVIRSIGKSYFERKLVLPKLISEPKLSLNSQPPEVSLLDGIQLQAF